MEMIQNKENIKYSGIASKNIAIEGYIEKAKEVQYHVCGGCLYTWCCLSPLLL